MAMHNAKLTLTGLPADTHIDLRSVPEVPARTFALR